jgi:hypothetical protein
MKAAAKGCKPAPHFLLTGRDRIFLQCLQLLFQLGKFAREFALLLVFLRLLPHFFPAFLRVFQGPGRRFCRLYPWALTRFSSDRKYSSKFKIRDCAAANRRSRRSDLFQAAGKTLFVEYLPFEVVDGRGLRLSGRQREDAKHGRRARRIGPVVSMVAGPPPFGSVYSYLAYQLARPRNSRTAAWRPCLFIIHYP